MSRSDPEDRVPGGELTLPEVARLLGVHYMTAYRYVRTGRLPASRSGDGWLVKAPDVERFSASALTRRAGDRRRLPARVTREAFEARLLAGDGPGAWQLVATHISNGMSPPDVLTGVVVPVMRSIGDRWAAGRISVGDEHRATAVASKIVGRIGLQAGRRGKRRGTVVVAAPEGDPHILPVAIGADLLRWRGFEVVELGANTPAASLAEAVGEAGDLLAVGMACSTSGLDASLRAAVLAAKAAAPTVPLLLGGGALAEEAAAQAAGADVFTGSDSDELLGAVERIASGSPARRVGKPASLPEH